MKEGDGPQEFNLAGCHPPAEDDGKLLGDPGDRVDHHGFEAVHVNSAGGQQLVDRTQGAHAETVGHDGRRQWLPDHWLHRLRSWWQSATARRRQSLAALPPDKRLATRLLMIIGAIMLVSIFFPRLMSFGIFILVIYLLWFMYKR